MAEFTQWLNSPGHTEPKRLSAQEIKALTFFARYDFQPGTDEDEGCMAVSTLRAMLKRAGVSIASRELN